MSATEQNLVKERLEASRSAAARFTENMFDHGFKKKAEIDAINKLSVEAIRIAEIIKRQSKRLEDSIGDEYGIKVSNIAINPQGPKGENSTVIIKLAFQGKQPYSHTKKEEGGYTVTEARLTVASEGITFQTEAKFLGDINKATEHFQQALDHLDEVTSDKDKITVKLKKAYYDTDISTLVNTVCRNVVLPHYLR